MLVGLNFWKFSHKCWPTSGVITRKRFLRDAKHFPCKSCFLFTSGVRPRKKRNKKRTQGTERLTGPKASPLSKCREAINRFLTLTPRNQNGLQPKTVPLTTLQKPHKGQFPDQALDPRQPNWAVQTDPPRKVNNLWDKFGNPTTKSTQTKNIKLNRTIPWDPPTVNPQ